MKRLSLPVLQLLLAILWLSAGTGRSALWINEILFNPPGPDTPNEYIELRGTPSLVIPAGTYFVSVAGDTNNNPGTIKNVFDLSGKVVGGNGFLVLLQKGTPYTANSNATILVNTGSDPGWGSGPGSSIGHVGDGGMTGLQHAPVTFFLIQTTNPPAVGADIDPNDNGAPQGPPFSSWTILDSVGLLDNNGTNNIAYGAINFRRNTNDLASGTIVPVSFTASYVGRSSNTTGWAVGDWVAADNLSGSAPNYSLGSTGNTQPPIFTGAPLNHLGAPNFGAPAIPGVLICQAAGKTDVSENGGTNSYAIALNTVPAGSVTIQLSTDAELQVSTDNGASWASTKTLTFANSAAAKVVLVRGVEDNLISPSVHPVFVHHTVSTTTDAARYPLTTLISPAVFNLLENEILLLNEVKVHPPGPDEVPFQYIEVIGTPGLPLSNIFLLAIEGNSQKTPGTINFAVNLTPNRLGSNGLLVVMATNAPYSISPAATLVLTPRLNAPGALGSSSISFLLVWSPSPLIEGMDLDPVNAGVLAGLPTGAVILDAVGWSTGQANDLVYGGAVLSTSLPAPDAASRFPSNVLPFSASAWFYGSLAGTNGATLTYDTSTVSPGFPYGALLTPGSVNQTPISVIPPAPLSGVIGDPTNPGISFTVSDANANADALVVTASSNNPGVVPDSNLSVTAGPGGLRVLNLNPVGVGYATITITVSDGHDLGQITVPYAASAMGRPGGLFHTGASDGSTAIAIDPDLMFVGDDENQTIRLYHRYASGPLVSQFDFQPVLGLTAQEAGEVDIEASTRIGNRLIWLGSQSNNNAAQSRTNRSRVFATDLSGTGLTSTLTYVGRYDHLREDLINWDVNNLHGKGSNYYGFAASAADGVDPKTAHGFNIEGLSMAPGSSNIAFLGFRAPLIPPSARAAALIVTVTNFNTVVVSGGPVGSTRFGPPIELNLRCRGIRSMEASTNGVLISAGPPGKNTDISPHDFRLFTWSGNPADTPQERAADLSGMIPEGIVEVPPPPWTATTQLHIVSDEGSTDYYGDGIEAKHLPYPGFKKSRSDWVALGDAVVSPPPCTKFIVSNNTATLTWCSVAGLTYRVQWKSTLQGPEWTDLPGDVPATGALTSITFAVDPAAQRFYRLKVL